MSFVDLPADILGIITQHINFFDIVNLIQCGNQKLNALLIERCIVNVSGPLSIYPDSPLQLIRKWPSIVSSFKRLQKLDTGLEEFGKKYQVKLSIQNFRFETLRELNSLTYLVLQFTVTHPFSICSYPPNLTYLDLNFCGSEGQLTQLSNDFPKKLTSLSLYLTEELDIDPKQLPDGLTSLKLSHKLFANENLAKLPKELLLLELPNDLSATDDDIEMLPQTLTHLNLRSNELVTDRCFDVLPAGLTFLDLSCLYDFHVQVLPPNLKTLIIPNSVYKHDSSSHVKSNLLYLHASLKDPIFRQQRNYNVLPSSLTHLHLSDCDTGFSPKFIPRSVTELIFSRNTVIDDYRIKDLPSGLRHLEMHENARMTSLCFKDLPRTLTYLDLNYCNLINDHRIEDLPKSLKFLNLQRASLTDDGISKLPEGLEYLNIAMCTQLTDAGVAKLPRKLTFLDISHAEKITEKCFGDLPRGLTTFKLSIESDHISKSDLESLPRNLTYLELMGLTPITDEAIKGLPQSLLNLRLPENFTLTDACCPNLPRSLTFLSLSANQRLTSACFKLLPPSLTAFDAFLNSNFTSDCFEDVPKRLYIDSIESGYRDLYVSRNNKTSHKNKEEMNSWF